MRWPKVLFALLFIVTVAVPGAHGQGCSFVTQRLQCKSLTCNQTSGLCVPCTADAQCYDGAFGCYNGRCKMMPLSQTFTAKTLLAPLVGFLVCAIAVLAGVGGGAILVPLFVVILEIPMVDAVGLSQATICGQSLLNVALQMFRHHPDHAPPNPTRPNINYEYCNLLLPIALTGTLLGNIASKVSPDWLRIVLLLVLFSYVLFRLIRRILDQRARDMEARALMDNQRDSDSDFDGPNDDRPRRKSLNSAGSTRAQEPNEPLEEKPQFPIWWILWTLFVFCVYFILSYASKYFVECGSAAYIAVVVAAVVAGCVLTLLVRAHLARLRERILLEEISDALVPFKWNTLTTIVFPAICVAAGFAAAMLGIGGGLVFSSLLLEAGLSPAHASATGGLATFLVAVQAAADFVLDGELRYDYGLMMFGAGVLSTVFGQLVLMRQIVNRGATYLVVVALATIMGGSMVAVTGYGIVNTIRTLQNCGSLNFGSVCAS